MFSDTPSEEDQEQSPQAQQVEEEKSRSPLVQLGVTPDRYMGRGRPAAFFTFRLYWIWENNNDSIANLLQ